MEALKGRKAALRILRPLTKWELRPAEPTVAKRTPEVRTTAMEVSPSLSRQRARSIPAGAWVPREFPRPVAEGAAQPGAGQEELPEYAAVQS
jgi:hypothetical protein